MLVLVIEDEVDLATTLEYNLRAEGFTVRLAHSGRQGLASATADPLPDVIVLDLMLPDLSGTEICRKLREGERTRDIPVIMCTAKGEEIDRVVGFEVGADDYVVKPFSVRELVLRIRALLRRVPPPVVEARLGPVRIGSAFFDMERQELRDASGPIRLTAGEAALLTALARKPNEVLSREDIAEALGMDDSGERAVDVQVVRLRRKIEADPREPRFLHTVRGRGYTLKPGF